jgi:hypothetical protein
MTGRARFAPIGLPRPSQGSPPQREVPVAAYLPLGRSLLLDNVDGTGARTRAIREPWMEKSFDSRVTCLAAAAGRESARVLLLSRALGRGQAVLFGLSAQLLEVLVALIEISMQDTILDRYIRAHNQGVRTGDFTSLVALFAEGAVMSFVDLPVGTFHGREAIVRAFDTQPPDDELVVVDSTVGDDGDEVIARYRWKWMPEDPGGTLRIRTQGDLIHRLLIHATINRRP